MKARIILVVICAVVALTNFTMAQSQPSVPLALHWSEQSVASGEAPSYPDAPPNYCKPCLFYGGDVDFNFSNPDFVIFADGYSVGWSGGKTADNVQMYSAFTVPKGKTWTVTGLFSNISFINTGLMDPSTPRWSIHSGMKAGDKGIIIASGESRGTATPTGRCIPQASGCEYTVLVKLPKAVKLSAGTYYESVEPLCLNTGDSTCTNAYYYLSDTVDSTGTRQGPHAYGPKEPKGQNFQNGPDFGLNYMQIDAAYCRSEGYAAVTCNWMSDGVIGTEE
jgi:hypothetical protein